MSKYKIMHSDTFMFWGSISCRSSEIQIIIINGKNTVKSNISYTVQTNKYHQERINVTFHLELHLFITIVLSEKN